MPKKSCQGSSAVKTDDSSDEIGDESEGHASEAEIKQSIETLKKLANQGYFPAIWRLIEFSEIKTENMSDSSDANQWMQAGLKFLEPKNLAFDEDCAATLSQFGEKDQLNAEFFNCLGNMQVQDQWPLSVQHDIAHAWYRQGESHRKQTRFIYYRCAYQYGHLEAGWKLWQKMNEFTQDNAELREHADTLLQALAEHGYVDALETAQTTKDCKALIGIALQHSSEAAWIQNQKTSLQKCNLSPPQRQHFKLNDTSRQTHNCAASPIKKPIER